MKTKPLSPASGFTLLEVLVAAAITAVMFGSFLTAVIALQKCFYSADDYTTALNNTQRVADYLSRDIRRASAATVSGASNETLTLTIPSYYTSYDAQGNPSSALTTGAWNGTRFIYNGGQTLTVVYALSGSTVLRQQTGATANLMIAENVPDFRLSFSKPTSTSVNYTISFSSKFLWNRPGTGSTAGGSISETVTMRNATN